MAYRASRHLLRELSTPARSSLRLPARSTIFTPRRTASTYGREPPPQPQTPSQQLAERALLQKLSTLSPEQISTLLSAQPDAPTGHVSPIPPQPPRSRWKTFLVRLAIGTVSLLVGHELGDMLIDSNRYLSWAQQSNELSSEEDGVMHPVQRAQALFEFMCEMPSMEFTMPVRETYQITNNGAIYMVRPELAAKIKNSIEGKPPEGWNSQRHLILPSGSFDIPIGLHYVDSGPTHERSVPLAFPADFHVMMATDKDGEAQRRGGLISNTFNTAYTLGLLNHRVFDHHTGTFTGIVNFGRNMCGWPGIVHGGALATACLDHGGNAAAAYFFHGEEFSPSKMEITYHHSLAPNDPVVISSDTLNGPAEIRQEFISRKAAEGPEAVAAALEGITDPKDEFSEADFQSLLSELAERAMAKEQLTLITRMSRAGDGMPVCEAYITFKKIPGKAAEDKD